MCRSHSPDKLSQNSTKPVSSRGSPRGCYEENAPVDFQLYQAADRRYERGESQAEMNKESGENAEMTDRDRIHEAALLCLYLCLSFCAPAHCSDATPGGKLTIPVKQNSSTVFARWRQCVRPSNTRFNGLASLTSQTAAR